MDKLAIDSAETTEVDDSISWDSETDMVWVHIADPTRYFREGREDPLLMKAIHHASTVYLPTGHIGMFPDKTRERATLFGCKQARW